MCAFEYLQTDFNGSGHIIGLVMSHSLNILTHTSIAKYFRNVTLINTRGLAEIIVPFTGYGRHSPNQVMIEME